MWYVVLIVVAVAVVVGAVFYLMRRSSIGEPDAVVAPPRTDDASGFHPPASDFHVAGGEAHVYFEVPLPDGDPDPVLTEILLREAVEVLRAKRSHLPLDGVSTVHAHARRNGDHVQVGKLTLDGPGELPPPIPPGEHPFGRRQTKDLFDELAAEAAARPEVAVRTPGDELAPLTDELRLTTLVEAGLRTQGIDPRQASFHELVTGLLRVAGYSITGDTETSVTATKGGDTYYVELVDHEAGDHPELAERALAGFVGRFAQSGSSRGLLFTPKYAPFAIYERERRDPRVRFVTRERFPGFVDALNLG